MSVSQSWFGAGAVNSRRTRSSCTGGPGLAAQAALLGEHRPDPLAASTAAATRFSPAADAAAGQLVGDEPVPERRVVAVDVAARR